MRIPDENYLDQIFTYHKPNEQQQQQYLAIRNAAKDFARTVINNTPNCADQTAALRKIREAMMVANASVALNGLV